MVRSLFAVAKREIKLGLRSPLTYSFLVLLSLFTTAVFLLQSGIPSIQGYTDMTGTVLNIILYLLPLITLLLGGMSVTGEKDSGQWGLLSTYPISRYTLLWGKWMGLAAVSLAVLLFSFGLAGVIAILFGQRLRLETLWFLWTFSALLALVYLSVAVWIGAVSKNRWQSLIGGVVVWFVTILLWPLMIISALSHLPSYKWIQPVLEGLTFFNPAEWLRIFAIMRMGAGSAFGASYDQWITWATSSQGLLIFGAVWLAWISLPIWAGGLMSAGGDQHGSS